MQAREDRIYKCLPNLEKLRLRKLGQGKPIMTPSYSSAIDLEDVLCKATIMNHQRQKFSFELLYFSFLYIMPTIREENLFNSTAIGRLLHNLFEQLDLCIAPFNSLNNEGNIEPLLRRYPNMIRLYAVGNKPNIIKTGFFLQVQLHHMINNRPDLIQQIGNCCTSLNEVFIEHNNSIIARNLEGLRVTFPTIRKTSILIEKKRQQRSDLKKLLHRSKDKNANELKRNSSSMAPTDSMSEVRKQVHRFTEDGSLHQMVKEVSVNFLLPLLRSYAMLKHSDHQEKLFNEYRPLQAIGEKLKEAADSFKKYVHTQRNKEIRLRGKQAEPAQPLQLTALTSFLTAQTAAILKQIISVLILRPPEYLHLLRSFTTKSVKATLQGAKANQVTAISTMFVQPKDPEAALLNDAEAIQRIKSFCKALHILLHKAKAFDPSNPTTNKALQRPLQEVLTACPNKDQALEILGNLDWNPAIVFPFK